MSVVSLGSLGHEPADRLRRHTDQIGYIGRTYVDGQPVLAEAFQRLKLA